MAPNWRRSPWDPILAWPVLASLKFALVLIVISNIAALVLTVLPLPRPAGIGDILSTLWQVQAAMLGLAVAVAIFAYQALHSPASGRRRVILLTGFPAAMVLGVTVLFLTGAAYLGSGWLWTGWLGVLAAGETGAWIILLLLTLAQAPHLQDQRYGLQLRLRVLRMNARRIVARHVITRVSASVLEGFLNRVGAVTAPWISGDAPEQRILPPSAGVLLDASLPRLRDAAQQLSGAGGVLQVSLRLGTFLRSAEAVAGADVAIPARARELVTSALVIRRDDGSVLQEDLADLHGYATTALESAPDLVDEVLSAYLAILEEYATGWRVFSPELEANLFPQFGEGLEAPIDQIRESVLKLYRQSIESRARDSAFQVAYFPLAAFQRALTWRAPGYFQLLSLFPSFYWLASQRTVPDDMQEIFRERAWVHLVEGMEFVVPAMARNFNGAEDELMLTRARAALQSTMFAVMRGTVRAGDWANFREGLRRWRIANQ